MSDYVGLIKLIIETWNKYQDRKITKRYVKTKRKVEIIEELMRRKGLTK